MSNLSPALQARLRDLPADARVSRIEQRTVVSQRLDGDDAALPPAPPVPLAPSGVPQLIGDFKSVGGNRYTCAGGVSYDRERNAFVCTASGK